MSLAITISQARAGRAAVARNRARLAQSMLAGCRLCAHACGANRLAAQTGPCRAGAETRFFSAQTEVSDELELVPTFAVALSGCDLRCNFCITGAHSWNPRLGQPLDGAEMASRAMAALEAGARTIMILGGEPTIHLPTALEFVSFLPEDAKVVWKTNAHGHRTARELADGMFDVWLADYKFGNDACAERLAGTRGYSAIVQENLRWASEHSELIVRHLLMPGHVECCWRPVAEWLAASLPGVKTSLRPGFWPAWRSRWHPELRHSATPADQDRAFGLARSLGLNLIL